MVTKNGRPSKIRHANVYSPKYIFLKMISDDILRLVSFSHVFFQYSPSSFSDDEQPTFELWVATSNARHSVATIIDYSGKFTNIEVTTLHTVTIMIHNNYYYLHALFSYAVTGCGGGGFPCPEHVCGTRQGVDGI